MIYYQDNEGLAVNLYTASEADVDLSGGLHVAVRQETDYPNSGRVVIRVEPDHPAEFAVRLRIPAWCGSARVIVDGGPKEAAAAGRFYRLQRTWKPGDHITLEMPMDWRLVRGRKRQSGRVAVMRGPLVFCLNPQQNEKIAEFDGADLGQITLDPQSLGEPVPDHSVRPDGLACPVQAWKPGYACRRPGDLKLRLSEFADPGGRAVYFRLQDFTLAVDDELLTRDGG